MISARQAAWGRIRRSGLVQPFFSPEETAAELAGVQAQIQPAAGLAIRNRFPGFTDRAFGTALEDTRTLVKLWGQRGTLHVYASADWPLLHGALDLRPTWWVRRLESGTAASDRFEVTLARVAEELAARGTLSRRDLRSPHLAIDEDLLSSWGGIFAELVRRGVACHAGRDSADGLFAHRDHWLPNLAWDVPDVEAANIEIARRYLRANGPATAHDLAYWRGGTVAQAQRWVNALHGELAGVTVDGPPPVWRGTQFVLANDLEALRAEPPAPEEWPVRLLYRFDPLLLAHKAKSWLIDEERYKAVWRPAGHIEGTVFAEGRILGTWNYRRRSRELDVSVAAFRPLTAPIRRTIKHAAADAAGYFDLEPGSLSITSAGRGRIPRATLSTPTTG